MFTIKHLMAELSITKEQAKQVIGIIRGTVSPFDIPATDEWRRQCYHQPYSYSPETRMHAIDAVIGTLGIEAIWGTELVAEYCNTGDTYDTTILFDYTSHKYRLMSWGDWVERYGDRHGVE